MSYESYGRIMPAQPLMPPSGATSQRLITSDRIGQGNKAQCEGAGGVYTEHCPSMAQVGIMGPKPMVPGIGPGGKGLPFSMPCVSHCEMPSGQRASAGQERPGARWDPDLQQVWGYEGGYGGILDPWGKTEWAIFVGAGMLTYLAEPTGLYKKLGVPKPLWAIAVGYGIAGLYNVFSKSKE